MLRGMAMKNKKIKITIILLSVLLCISIAALAVAILEHHPRNIKYSEENQVLDSDKTAPF